jgi:hypothetical protein
MPMAGFLVQSAAPAIVDKMATDTKAHTIIVLTFMIPPWNSFVLFPDLSITLKWLNQNVTLYSYARERITSILFIKNQRLFVRSGLSDLNIGNNAMFCTSLQK